MSTANCGSRWVNATNKSSTCSYKGSCIGCVTSRTILRNDSDGIDDKRQYVNADVEVGESSQRTTCKESRLRFCERSAFCRSTAECAT